MPAFGSTQALPPTAFFLTPQTLGDLGASRGETSALFGQARALLNEAQVRIFEPYLSEKDPSLLRERFEWGANTYAPIRIHILSLLWADLGARNFELRYIVVIVKATEAFVSEAEKWGLKKEQVENMFRDYLRCATRLVLIAEQIAALDAPTLLSLISNITKTDFGLTALALAFEGAIQAEKWMVQETLRLTKEALSSYAASIDVLLRSTRPQGSVSGSLKIEGDLDRALEEFSSVFRNLLHKKESPQ
jgi:hypothetical protein